MKWLRREEGEGNEIVEEGEGKEKGEREHEGKE